MLTVTIKGRAMAEDNNELFPLSSVAQRAIRTSTEISMIPVEEITYQHTVLCQTAMPYRSPGKDVREWIREQGKVSLLIEAGQARNPETDQWVKLGLPFGPKARLVLAHLNAEALKQGSNVVQVEESLTAFIKRILDPLSRGKGGPTGPQIRTFKKQLAALSAATIRMAISTEDRSLQVNSQIVTAFDLWFPKNDQQRVLWPSEIHLSHDYYNSLTKHAIPLDERALGALSHSAMALDIYAWLAQRLHRIDPRRPQFITWAAVKGQFGHGYGRMRDFRRVFLVALKQVILQYQAADVEADGHGLTLRNSMPPVPPRAFIVPKRQDSMK